jgi:hypothetical protein
MAQASTSWNGLSRPVLGGGTVDLVTGMPLLQVTDLELPVGGATFRLTRTASATPSVENSRINTLEGLENTDLWWDWTGSGWMISENPLLLIDSTLAASVGNNPPTCWFVIDAHRSIPFQRIEGTARYEAPPRFRATLTHNGELSATAELDHDGFALSDDIKDWVTPPTEWTVSLYEGAIRYTFVTIAEKRDPDGASGGLPLQFIGDDIPLNPAWNPLFDAPDNTTYVTSYHDRPHLLDELTASMSSLTGHNPYSPDINPGFGVPMYALCTRIEDRYGHAVQIEYLDTHTRALQEFPHEPSNPDGKTNGCVTCQQDTIAKGQIKWIKLWDNGSVVWSLAYVHRRVAGQDWVQNSSLPEGLFSGGPCVNPQLYDQHGYNVIDRILVFEGNKDLHSLPESFFTIPWTDRMTLPRLDCDELYDGTVAGQNQIVATLSIYGGADPVDEYDGLFPFLATWEHQIRHHYDFHHSPDYIYPDRIDPTDPGLIKGEPTLLMTTVRSKKQDGSEPRPFSETQRIFKHDSSHRCYAIYEHADIQSVIANNSLTSSMPPNGPYTVESFARDNAGFSAELAGKYASIYLTFDGTIPTTGSRSDAPAADVLRATHTTVPRTPYLKMSPGELSRMVQGGSGAVHTLSTKLDGDIGRHYRIHRIAVMDEGWPGGSEDIESTTYHYTWPMPSAFHAPFQWHTYRTDNSNSTANPPLVPPVMNNARWVSVIDEFGGNDTSVASGGYDAARSSSSAYSGTGIKPGQSSRRVVNVNAAGVVLKDFLWKFTPDGTVVEGSGLGEEARYEYVEDYIATRLPSGVTLESIPTSVRKDLLLTAVGSVGWSSLDPADQDDTGLVTFTEYRLAVPLSGWTPEEAVERFPWTARIQRVGTGVMKGLSASTRYYQSQTMYHADRPWDVQHEIRFLTPVSSLLTSYTPAWTSGPPTGYAVTTISVERANVSGVNPLDQRVLATTTIAPGRRQFPSSDWYYPVERQEFDNDGQLVLSATGLVRNPDSPGSGSADPLETLIFTAHRSEGYIYSEVAIDVVPGGTATRPSQYAASSVWNIPASNSSPSWGRISATTPANLVTVTLSDHLGPTDIFYPDGPGGEPGLRFARRWDVFGIDGELFPDGIVTREYIFNNIKPVPSSSSFTSSSPGELRVYAGTKPGSTLRSKQKGFFVEPSTGSEPTAPAAFALTVTGNQYAIVDGTVPNTKVIDETSPGVEPPFFPLAETKVIIDSTGRPSKADFRERSFTGLWLAADSKLINELVDVRREQQMDGTITRTTRSLIGQHMRSYSGTLDESWTGDSAEWIGGAYIKDPLTSEPGPHNMILKERFRYGTGVNDAWRPTVRWTYRSHTRGGFADDFYTSPATDADGYPTVTQYDWRMRPVRVDQYGKGTDLTTTIPEAARLSTVLTYYDHADRAYLVVTFGGAESGRTLDLTAVDPVVLESAEGFDADDFNWSAAGRLRPVSIAHTFYSSDGNPEEVRRYNFPATHTGTVGWTSEWRFRGFGNQEVFSKSPNGPAVRTVLDGLGRTKKVITGSPSSTVSSFYELTSTESVYDTQGNVIEEIRLERAPGGTGNALDHTSNAIRTRQFHWYDTERRRIATADVGTQRDTFTVGAAQSAHDKERNASPPTVAVTSTSVTVTRGSHIASSARLSFSVYDTITGNLIYTVSPDEVVTCRRYGVANRLSTIIENYTGGSASDKRSTGYAYQYGRVISMLAAPGADLNPEDTSHDAGTQVSDVVYGADILDENFELRSRDNGLVGEFKIPAPSGGDASAQATIVLRYTFTGKIAERIDLRGVVFRYAYDSLDRLKSITVGHYDNPDEYGDAFNESYPGTMDTPVASGGPVVPADRVGFVEYAYSPRTGQITSVLAMTATPGKGGSVIAYNQFDYDAEQSLTQEIQSIGSSTITSSTPRIGYNWSYTYNAGSSTIAGRSRLAYMDYPAHGGHLSRRVSMVYGAGSSVDDLLNRITAMETRTTTSGAFTNVAGFTYGGDARRSKLTLGSGIITSDLAAPSVAGLPGLDMFGRIKDLHFTTTLSGTHTLHRAQYAYDAAGNRTSASVTRATSTYSSPETNVWSQANAYNDLGQLIETDFGTLNSSNVVPTPIVSDEWLMSVFGNWNGTSTAAGRKTTDYRPTTPAVREVKDITTDRNRITDRLDTDVSSSQKNLVYDTAGNLVSDGVYFYQYDAWNRLVQISNLDNNASFTALAATDVNPVLANYPVLPGKMLKHFKYDGLGRLVEVQSPFPDEESEGGLRVERFYYDGVRRIQELVVDPVETIELVLGGEGAPEEVVLEAQNSQGAPGEASADQTTSTAGMVTAALGGPPSTAPLSNMNREYIWGPGDRAWGGGVDELLVQFDLNRLAWYMLTDASGDVVAMCKRHTSGLNAYAKVSAQWTYDAYGSVVTAEQFDSTAPVNRCGHKGLFVDRLDVGVVNASTEVENPRLVSGADHVYYNRNRSFSPRLGRFLQSDPNATGVAVMGSLTRHGRAAAFGADEFNLERHYGDGSNSYGYLESSPWGMSDPLGLYGTPFDTAMMGVTVGRFASELVGEYAFNQMTDIDWAMDWGSGDDEHSRLDASWIDEITTTFIHENTGVTDAIMASRTGNVVDMVRGTWKLTKAATELHHVIPMFMGGLKKGLLAKMPKDLHRVATDNLHSMINTFCKGDPMKLSPNARGGGKAIQAWLGGASILDVQKFRQGFYKTLQDFDNLNGTSLAREFSRELVRQRKVKGKVGLFQ